MVSTTDGCTLFAAGVKMDAPGWSSTTTLAHASGRRLPRVMVRVRVRLRLMLRLRLRVATTALSIMVAATTRNPARPAAGGILVAIVCCPGCDWSAAIEHAPRGRDGADGGGADGGGADGGGADGGGISTDTVNGTVNGIHDATSRNSQCPSFLECRLEALD